MLKFLKNIATKKFKYWGLVLIILAFFVYIYYNIFTSPTLINEQRSQLINILGYLGTFLFASIAGYFAYSQLLEMRFDKLKDEAFDNFIRGKYARAVKYYSEALAIKPHEFSVVSEYSEVLITLYDFKTFDDQAYKLEKYAVDKREHLVAKYLFFARYMLQENLGFAKKYIRDTIEYYKLNQTIFVGGNWSFKEIKDSDIYIELSGESKKIFDNYLNFIEGKLSNEHRIRFIDGDYVLN